ncbi:hypothetical protein [Pseudonocardia sp. ICBG601]|nr:hypothetical protein [Pseudonocardia sp. ICBG601]
MSGLTISDRSSRRVRRTTGSAEDDPDGAPAPVSSAAGALTNRPSS